MSQLHWHGGVSLAKIALGTEVSVKAMMTSLSAITATLVRTTTYAGFHPKGTTFGLRFTA